QVLSAAVERERHLNSGVVLQFGDQRVLLCGHKAQQNGFGARTLDSDERRLGRGVFNNHVKTSCALQQGRSHNRSVSGVRNHQEFVGATTVGDEVVDDAAVFLADQRVLALALGHGGNFAYQRIVQDRRRVRSGDPDFAHVGEVEQAGGLADGVVLGQLGGVLKGHLPAAEIREGRAQFLVLFVESSVVLSHLQDRPLVFEVFDRRAGADQVAVSCCAVDAANGREVLVLLEVVHGERSLLTRVCAVPVRTYDGGSRVGCLAQRRVLNSEIAGGDLLDFGADGDHGFDETVDLHEVLRLCGLHHKGSGNRERQRGSVEAEVDEALGNIFSCNACAGSQFT